MVKNSRNYVGYDCFHIQPKGRDENIPPFSSFLYTALNEQNKIHCDYRSLIIAEKLGLSESTAHVESAYV